jgi:GNAT superfamily N-acetyltransferase
VTITISPVGARDRDVWLGLWEGYLRFYETELDPATTRATFERLNRPGSGIYGALARDGDREIGLVHWLTHPATWTTTDYCYLEDLYVAPDARGAGAARALIEHVRAWAQEHGSMKVYWLTAETNTVARGLYDRVANRSGMVQYEIPL